MTTINDRLWGLEVALTKALSDIETGKPIDRSDTERRIQSGARKNRHRARLLRLQPLNWQPNTTDPTANYETRSDLAFLSTKIGNEDYSLIKNLACGASYDELAGTKSVEVATIRKRISRLRKKARELLPQD